MNDLHARLAATDPAADLTPLPDARRAALLGRASAAPRRRTPRPGLVALGGVAVVAIAAGVAFAARGVGVSDGPVGPTVTVVAAVADPTSICAPLDDFAVDALRRTDLAVEGRVTAVDGDTAEVVPLRILRGSGIGLLRIRTDSGGGPALDGPVLRSGERVLVAAANGRAQGCGLSAAESPELLRFYEQAFGG